MRQASVHIEALADIAVNLASFRRHIAAENLSEATVYAYCGAVEQFTAFLREKGMPTDVTCITREHVESFITDLLKRRKATPANQRYRGMARFFSWLLEEGEPAETPMRALVQALPAMTYRPAAGIASACTPSRPSRETFTPSDP